MPRTLTALLGALIALTLAAPASARVIDCNAAADFHVIITSARNMSCGAAKFDMRRYRSSIRKRFTTPKGFTCNRISGGTFGGTWRCVKGAQAYRFDFGD